MRTLVERIAEMSFRLLDGLIRAIQGRQILQSVRNGVWRARLGRMGTGSNFYSHVIIHSAKSVTFGDRCSIANFVHIWGAGGVEFGNNVMLASHSVITSQTHDKDADIYRDSSIKQRVVIGDNVWIGTGAIILSGVTIGTGAIVAAGSVVTKNVDRFRIVAGVPARDIGPAGQRGSLKTAFVDPARPTKP